VKLEIQKKINKKKEAKVSSRYSKKQVQAFQVFEKISTHNVSLQYFPMLKKSHFR
jgi:hypothetical protein